jgi:hypothetical protein
MSEQLEATAGSLMTKLGLFTRTWHEGGRFSQVRVDWDYSRCPNLTPVLRALGFTGPQGKHKTFVRSTPMSESEWQTLFDFAVPEKEKQRRSA